MNELKYKCRPGMFETALLRKTNLPPLPEVKLAVAVIRQAFSDFLTDSKHRKVNGDVAKFFYDGTMDLWASKAGIPPGIVIEFLERAIEGVDFKEVKAKYHQKEESK